MTDLKLGTVLAAFAVMVRVEGKCSSIISSMCCTYSS
jgi:hypothetical protein